MILARSQAQAAPISLHYLLACCRPKRRAPLRKRLPDVNAQEKPIWRLDAPRTRRRLREMPEYIWIGSPPADSAENDAMQFYSRWSIFTF